MSYSIVARDPASGALGVAVQSCFFGVGATVPCARPGVGAVATQAFTDPTYGPRCLDALAAGASAAEALDKAAAADPAAFLRQVAVVGRRQRGRPHRHRLHRPRRTRQRPGVRGPGQHDGQPVGVAGHG